MRELTKRSQHAFVQLELKKTPLHTWVAGEGLQVKTQGRMLACV